MIRVIPVPYLRSNYEFVSTLDGSLYRLRLRHNARVDRWFLTVLDSSGVELISGRKLVADVPFSPHETISGLPAGQLWIIDSTGAGLDPRLRDLGERVYFVYVDEDNAT